MKVVAVVVSFNGDQYIDRCIRSLLDEVDKIVVVDNNSKDNTISLLNNYKNIKIIKLNKNIGFGRANNIGIIEAFKYNLDYIFLINQDTYVKESSIEKLISILEKNPSYGILSPIHLAKDGKLDRSFREYISKIIGSDLLQDLILGKEEEIYEIQFVNAAFWMISAECIKNVGGFCPLFTHYAEDENYISRCKYHSFKVGITPLAIGVHDRRQVKAKNFNLKYLYNKTYVGYIKILLDISNPFLIRLKDLIVVTLKKILYFRNYKIILCITISLIEILLKSNQIYYHSKLIKNRGSNYLNGK